MIRPRRLPEPTPVYSAKNERDLRVSLEQHIRDVANDNASFRARVQTGAIPASIPLAPGSTATTTLSGFNGVTARVFVQPLGDGANGASPAHVAAWIESRTSTGCRVVLQNTDANAQSISADWLAVVPE